MLSDRQQLVATPSEIPGEGRGPGCWKASAAWFRSGPRPSPGTQGGTRMAKA